MRFISSEELARRKELKRIAAEQEAAKQAEMERLAAEELNVLDSEENESNQEAKQTSNQKGWLSHLFSRKRKHF